MSDTQRKILIVDDSVFIRQSFADYFEDNLWIVFQAESGERALELLEREVVDCAIIDIRLGGMDGNTLIEQILKKNFKMVFVICTGSVEYIIPPVLLEKSCVSKKVFIKPVSDMGEIKRELIQLLENN